MLKGETGFQKSGTGFQPVVVSIFLNWQAGSLSHLTGWKPIPHISNPLLVVQVLYF